MEIYLMRHGIASSADREGSSSDEERPLTPKGVKRTAKAAKGLVTLSPSIEHILTSPLLRARQTADIVAASLQLKDQLEEVEDLAPDGDNEKVLVRLATYQECQGILLVGHQPGLGEIASLLLVGGHNVKLNLKKSSICCIEVDSLPAAGHGKLNWMLAPNQLRRLARS